MKKIQSKQKSLFIDFAKWRGLALSPSINPKPKFNSDDDLWNKQSKFKKNAKH